MIEPEAMGLREVTVTVPKGGPEEKELPGEMLIDYHTDFGVVKNVKATRIGEKWYVRRRVIVDAAREDYQEAK